MSGNRCAVFGFAPWLRLRVLSRWIWARAESKFYSLHRAKLTASGARCKVAHDVKGRVYLGFTIVDLARLANAELIPMDRTLILFRCHNSCSSLAAGTPSMPWTTTAPASSG